ncbi:helix-turn-helix domain-containing protein [Cyanobium sp. ATX 6A2]|uniref:helix-turn-helix domain-containing protein n=1 Tax=Cyanobium sp. ATX 6A2 TaxID=2823700 RepID=UPI0020CD891C|nr:helix-turn-helix domain-containing protein [Cyanobium sp. ATX 6A2]MCP9886761.1 helix-turn-helix domain-containing protein [Cyanobium sp. ATX 6A2]
MAATRLSDDQKQEIVARYRDGASSTELAAAFACSPNTVSRVVKAALTPAEYEQLKQQRPRGPRSITLIEEAPEASAPAPELPPPALAGPEPEPEPIAAAEPTVAAEDTGSTRSRLRAEAEGDSDDDGPGVLAIDDADDFGDDADLEEALDDDDDAEEEVFFTVPVHLGAAVEERRVECRALSEAQLPETAYVLVDRSVELQPTPLGECPDLGPLPEQEAERQALMLFVNPRQAKRHCGRSQRVILLPDLSLLERTAPYLLAQGISRVVIEGGIYSLPGS